MSNTGEPLVSVVMATYNTEYAMLREAVESLIDQTYSNWELILIDDCSDKFNDFSFLDEYKDSRIKLFHNETNLGCTKCFNKGIRLAQGEYIARLDADDIALPKRFEVQVRYMERHPDVKVVSSISYTFGTSKGLNLVIPSTDGYMKAVALYRNNMAHSTVMFRRDLFDVDQMYYDESFLYGQDYELFVRILNKGYKIRQCNKCLVMVRKHGNQISTTERRIIQIDNIAKVRLGQLREYFGMTDRDVLCENLLHRGIARDGVTEEEAFAWIRKVLKQNKESGRFSQHYLRLSMAEKSTVYIKQKRSKKAAVLLVRTMPLEALQMLLIISYRKILFLFYSCVFKVMRYTTT